MTSKMAKRYEVKEVKLELIQWLVVASCEVKKDPIGDELLREELRLSAKDHKCHHCQLAATRFYHRKIGRRVKTGVGGRWVIGCKRGN